MEISEAVKAGHDRIRKAYCNFHNAKTSSSRKEQHNQLLYEVAGDIISEYTVLCHYYELVLADGSVVAEDERRTHTDIARHLKRLQSLLPGECLDSDHELEILWIRLSEQFKQQEDCDLPAFEEKLSRKESLAVGKALEETRNVALAL